MSRHAAFRRQPVEQQFAQNLRTLTFPAPTRGIIRNENEAYILPGGCIVCDNWAPTMRGVKLRGGTVLHCDLHSLDYLDTPLWANGTAYVPGNKRRDVADNSLWDCNVPHTSSPGPATFADDRAAFTDYWVPSSDARLSKPVISAFEYTSSNVRRMFAGQETKLFEVTTPAPVLIKSGQTSGNYVAVQFANAGTNWMIVANEAGDPLLRFNGSTWVTLDPSAIADWANSTNYADNALARDTADGGCWRCLPTHAHLSPATGTFAAYRTANSTVWTQAAAGDEASFITGPKDTQVEDGENLTYVWKYRNRLFFIEKASMNAWYLDPNAIGGTLFLIPLAGSASRGGHLMFGASWSLDAGDGTDEKCIFVTDLGEILIFTGSNPSDPNNWRQQGRYQLSAPMGMNAHIQIGGDMMIMTADGVIPLSQAITKSAGQLELATLTRTIKSLWRAEVATKRALPWTVKKWDEYGAIFVTTPGGNPGNRYCLLANNATGAWARFLGWDATCFIQMGSDFFFGTQDGAIMQADRTGYDVIWDAVDRAFETRPYLATLVGGWELFGASANHVVWHQSRASFKSSIGEPFQPQLSATVNYEVIIPPPPSPGIDYGILDVWDQGVWGPDQPWLNAHPYVVGDQAHDAELGTIWRVTGNHTSAVSGLFEADRILAAAGKWVQVISPSAFDMANYAQWDQPDSGEQPVRNTMWVSIGMTGFAHAPIVQVMIAQARAPSVELIAISATYEPAGVNV